MSGNRYTMAELVDLTDDVRRELQFRRAWKAERTQQLWQAFWIGFVCGLGLIVLVFFFCTLLGGGQ